jgi:hypothetical protein
MENVRAFSERDTGKLFVIRLNRETREFEKHESYDWDEIGNQLPSLVEMDFRPLISKNEVIEYSLWHTSDYNSRPNDEEGFISAQLGIYVLMRWNPISETYLPVQCFSSLEKAQQEIEGQWRSLVTYECQGWILNDNCEYIIVSSQLQTEIARISS